MTCSGGLFIFCFDKDLFLDLDLARLALLSISVSFPLLIINAYIYIKFSDIETETDQDIYFHAPVFYGSLLSFPVVYIPIITSFFWEINLKIAIAMIMGLQLLTFIAALIRKKLNK